MLDAKGRMARGYKCVKDMAVRKRVVSNRRK